MLQFIILTIGLLIGVGAIFSSTRRQEIMANWKKYRMNPIFLFSAFLFKPDTDPRSRLEFTYDNFKEVIDSLVTGLFEVVLSPIFKVFRLVAQSIEQTLSGFLGMRAIFGNMWRSFMDIIAVFMNRFALVLHQLRLVMFKLLTAFQRISGIATSSVFAGLSTVYSMLNFIDLIIKIAIIILVVLVVLIIFLFFVLAPFVPTVLVVIGIIASTAFGGAVGGMANSLTCFATNTPIRKKDGETVPIQNLRLGDILQDGGKVTGVMKFLAPRSDMYSVHGVTVAGSHILYTDEGPVLVRNYSLASPTLYDDKYIYCLTTTTHRIYVGNLIFSDWEEISESDEDQLTWNRFVFESLNGSGYSWTSPSLTVLHSESCTESTTRIQTPNGPIPAQQICPGMKVLDQTGLETIVSGVIQIATDQVQAVSPEGVSVGAWIWDLEKKCWKQNDDQKSRGPLSEKQFLSFLTESGSYLLECGVSVRDFTDVGGQTLESSYDWILSRLSH